MDRFSTSSEILFHGLPSKSKRPSIRKQIVTVNSIVFTKQASAERYLANIFCQYFCEILENFAANHKNVSKTFRKFSKKKTPVAKSYFSKVSGFYRSSHWRCSIKIGVLRKVLETFAGKHLCQRLNFNKVAGLRL